MKTRYKHIHFEEESPQDLGLGVLWFCYNNKGSQFLGSVPEKKVWKQYVFEPEANCIFNNGCLRDIADFLDQINP